MLRIGLTGGIGSGKTTVAKIFETLGIPVYYADAATRRLMNENAALRESIIKHFGPESYRDEILDPKWVASIVFNDAHKLQLLNSLTHPPTISDAEDWMQKQQTAYAIKEAALLFESGAEKHLDKVIGVYAPKELRIKRVMARDTATEEEILKRAGRQMDEEEKMNRCDFVIVNDENELVIPQVLRIHEALLREIPQGTKNSNG